MATNATNITNATTIAPPSTPAPHHAGAPGFGCDIFFTAAQAATCVFLIVGIAWVTERYQTPPKRGRRVDYGCRYGITLLLFNILLWIALPPVLLLTLFHFVIRAGGVDSVDGRHMACVQVSLYPLLSLGFGLCCPVFLMGCPENFRTALGSKINNDMGCAPPDNNQRDVGESGAAKVLMLGSVCRGIFYLDALRKNHNRQLGAETILMDYANAREAVVNNAIADNLVSRGEANQLNILAPARTRDNITLGIPLPDNSVDKVVVCPRFRQAKPFADELTSERETAQKMACVLAEACRVLRPGGTLNAFGVAPDALLIEADLVDLGCTNVRFDDLGVKTGALVLDQKRPYYHVEWLKPSRPTPTTNGAVPTLNGQQQRQEDHQNITIQAEATPFLIEQDHHTTGDPAHHRRRQRRNENKCVVLMGCYQFLLYAIFITISVFTYEFLAFPSNFANWAQVSNILPTIANSYLVLAYGCRVLFSRKIRRDQDATAVMDTQRRRRSRWYNGSDNSLLVEIVKFDLWTLVGATGCGLLVWGCSVGMTLMGFGRVLAAGTIAMSIVVPYPILFYFLIVKKKKLEAALRMRNVPERKWHLALDEAIEE